CFTRSAMTGFIAWVFLFPNRVSVRRRSEGLEPDDRKLSRPVLRGPGPSNGVRLLGLSTSRYPAQDSRPSGSLLLSRKALSSSASCRFSPAHWNRLLATVTPSRP